MSDSKTVEPIKSLERAAKEMLEACYEFGESGEVYHRTERGGKMALAWKRAKRVLVLRNALLLAAETKLASLPTLPSDEELADMKPVSGLASLPEQTESIVGVLREAAKALLIADEACASIVPPSEWPRKEIREALESIGKLRKEGLV